MGEEIMNAFSWLFFELGKMMCPKRYGNSK
jgi:hypothetical protein